MTANALHEIEIASRSRKFPAYPASRCSHVWGVPAIPNHWQEKPLKRVASINTDKLSEATDPDYEIEYVDIANVSLEAGITSTERYRFENAPSRARRRVRNGDTIVSTVRTYLKAVAHIINPPENLIVSTGFAVLRADSSLDPGFLYRLAQSEPLVERIMAHSVGVSYPAINASDIGRFAIPLPPLDEQRAIAAFLDRETARIDELIAKKQRFIEMLKEKRQAVISRAVTKGLDPNARMKASGIDWLAQVPAHWDVCKTKRVACLRTGHTPSRQHPEYWVDCTIPWFSLADVWQLREGRNDYLGETVEKISELGLANSAAELLPAGTVIVSRTASVGFSGIMPRAMATTQDFVNWICGPRLIPEYLLFVFRSMDQEFRRLTMGSTHKTIYMPDVWKFTTPVPPVNEQKEIVAYIRLEKERLELLEDTVSTALDRLRDYRSALITAAVTGQIDVRNCRKEASCP